MPVNSSGNDVHRGRAHGIRNLTLWRSLSRLTRSQSADAEFPGERAICNPECRPESRPSRNPLARLTTCTVWLPGIRVGIAPAKMLHAHRLRREPRGRHPEGAFPKVRPNSDLVDVAAWRPTVFGP